MKALVYTAPEQMNFMDYDQPAHQEAHSVVKVMASGICGSDMHGFLGHDERRPAPLILGHEAAGTVHGGADDGRRVTINPLVECGDCVACNSDRRNLCHNRQLLSMKPRNGAFAQYVAIPDRNLVTVPEHVTFEKAALAEPLACGWHAVKLGKAALDVSLADAQCLIIGGGAIGVGIALVLGAMGATQISVSEPNERRCAVLEKIGGFNVTNPQDNDMRNVDLVFDAVGYIGTREAAFRAVRPGGTIIHIGLGQSEGGVDVRRLTLQEITFIGTYCYTPDDFRQTAQAIFEGRLGALEWTESRSLSEGQEAFDDIRSGQAAAPKIILKPWQ